MTGMDPVRMKHRHLEQIALTSLRLARVLTESGVQVRVAHQGAAMVARGLGVDDVGLRSGYASLEITVTSGINTITRMMPVGRHGVNQRMMSAVYQLAQRVSKGGMSIEDVNRELALLAASTPRHPAWLVAVAVGLACAAFGSLLGVDWSGFIAVLVAGGTGQYVRHHLLSRGRDPYVVIVVVATIAASLGGLVSRLLDSHTVTLAMTSSTLLLVPGVPATNAQTDIMDGYPTVGSARAVSVLMVMIFVSIGIWLAGAVLGLKP